MRQPLPSLARRAAAALGLALLAGCQNDPVAGKPPAPLTLPSFTLQQLGVLPGGTQSQANFGNASIIVGWATDGANRRHAVRFAGGTAIRLAEPAGATTSEARGVNAGGVIVGIANIGGVQKPVYWASPTATGQVLQTLGGPAGFARAVNDSGVVLGWAETAARDTIIVLWDEPDDAPTRLDPVLGKDYSPAGINNAGQVVGNAGDDDAGGEAAGFLWESDDGFTSVESIGTPGNDGNGINGHGVIVGGFTTNDGKDRAYRWTEARGMVLLGEPPAGQVRLNGNAVNDSGLVAATASTTDSSGTVTSSVVAISSIFEPERQFTALPTLGGTRASGVDGAITPCGVVLGWAFPAGATTRRAVAWVPTGCSVP